MSHLNCQVKIKLNDVCYGFFIVSLFGPTFNSLNEQSDGSE